MRIYLMQHGKSVPKEEDPERPLSPQGRRDVERMAEFLQRCGMKIEGIFHSGKARARQTAEIMGSRLSPGVEPEERKGLSPLDDVEEIAEMIQESRKHLLLVGHLPHLAKITSLLILGSESTPVINFQQGGVACLEKDQEGRWSIAWILVPEIL